MISYDISIPVCLSVLQLEGVVKKRTINDDDDDDFEQLGVSPKLVAFLVVIKT